jgi:hypothetical protein
MVSLRFLASAAVAAAATLPPACAYGGRSGSTSDVAMAVFTLDRPPECDYEEVGRVSRERVTGPTESGSGKQDSRELIKQMGGDAVIRVDMPREYIVIRFTDINCRE